MKKNEVVATKIHDLRNDAVAIAMQLNLIETAPPRDRRRLQDALSLAPKIREGLLEVADLLFDDDGNFSR